MKLKLKKKPKGVTIIEGFPGFGLVGTITTEFLVEHLKAEIIGNFMFEEMPSIVAIHESKLVHPMGIYYDKKYNLLIFHMVTTTQGYEWKVSEALVDLAKELKAKELISVEGVGASSPLTEEKAFYFANHAKGKKKFEKIGVTPLKEGIIMGVTAALLLEVGNIPMSCIFADTHSQFPDSKAAARVIEILDKYLGLKVDTAPLLKQAEKFEEKIKGLLQQSSIARSQQEKKMMSYVG